MRTYIFFRKEGWYPVRLKDDADALANAKLNPGTLKVETVKGRVVWSPFDAAKHQQSVQ